MGQTCRACSSHDTRFLYCIAGHRVVRCRACSHVFLDHTHDRHSIIKLYENYGSRGTTAYFQGITDATIEKYTEYLHACRKHCLSIPAAPRLLDIGCGTGALLKRATEMGFAAEGMEICEPLARLAEERTGCRVHTTFLADMRAEAESFDVITMYDLIEHLPEPRHDLQAACRLLRPGGVLFAVCPNDDSLIRRFSRLLYGLSFRCFDQPMKLLYYPYHLSYFTRTSLYTLMQKSSFEIVSCKTANPELSRLDIAPLYRPGVKLLFWISQYARGLGGKFIVYARKKPASPQ